MIFSKPNGISFLRFLCIASFNKPDSRPVTTARCVTITELSFFLLILCWNCILVNGTLDSAVNLKGSNVSINFHLTNFKFKDSSSEVEYGVKAGDYSFLFSWVIAMP